MIARILANEVMASWSYSVLPALVVGLTSLIGTFKLRSTLTTLGSVKSPADLPIVRNAINLNMRFASAILVGWALYLVMLFCLVLSQRLWIIVALCHLAIFGFLSSIIGLYSLKVERSFRKMPVRASDPFVALTFERWIKEWRSLRMQLSD
jgi:hypothetical protein